jgi:hypothetical protein
MYKINRLFRRPSTPPTARVKQQVLERLMASAVEKLEERTLLSTIYVNNDWDMLAYPSQVDVDGNGSLDATLGVDAFAEIQEAIDNASDEDVLKIIAGSSLGEDYGGFNSIYKDLTLQGVYADNGSLPSAPITVSRLTLTGGAQLGAGTSDVTALDVRINRAGSTENYGTRLGDAVTLASPNATIRVAAPTVAQGQYTAEDSGVAVVNKSVSFVAVGAPTVSSIRLTNGAQISLTGDLSTPVVEIDRAGSYSGPGTRLSDAQLLLSTGGQINAAAGTWVENLVVTKRLTLDGAGAGSTILEADTVSQPALTLTTDATGTGASQRLIVRNLTVSGSDGADNVVASGVSYLTLENLAITGAGQDNLQLNLAGSRSDIRITNSLISGALDNGIEVVGSGTLTGLVIDGGTVQGNRGNGLLVAPDSPTGVTGVTVENATFAGNGWLDSSSPGNIKFHEFEGSATIQNVDVIGDYSAGTAPNDHGTYGINFTGNGGAAGTIALLDVDFSGRFRRSALQIQGYSQIDGFNAQAMDVDLKLARTTVFTSPLAIDHTDSDKLDLGTSHLNRVNLWNVGGADATDASFFKYSDNSALDKSILADNFIIADQIGDAVDATGAPASASVSFKAGEVFITPDSFVTTAPFNMSAANVNNALKVAGTGLVHVQPGTYSGGANISTALTLHGSANLGGPLSATAGSISPGAAASYDLPAEPPASQIGSFTATDISLASGVVFAAQIASTSPSGFDQLVATGTVSLGNATLVVSTLGYTPVIGNSFRLIDNQGAGPITGKFAGLPEGATVTIGGLPFTISYFGGTGNDVTLTLANPTTVYVNDDWVITTDTSPAGLSPGDIVSSNTGAGDTPVSDLVFGYTAWSSVNSAIGAVATAGTVNVLKGTYVEDVLVNKTLSLVGQGMNDATISGAVGGSIQTIDVTASNVLIKGFKITREGNNSTDWNGALNNNGVVFGGGTNGGVLEESLLTGNRNGVLVQNTNVTIRNNIVDFNRTGIHVVDATALITENEITNNWTFGVFFRTEGGASTNAKVFNNEITGNWYAGIGRRFPDAYSATLDASGNWFGTATPEYKLTSTTDPAYQAEPGYAGQIPAVYPGGSATNPGTGVDIIDINETSNPTPPDPISKIDFSPWLAVNTDTDTPTSPGASTIGFQGDFSSLIVGTQGAQSGSTGRIQEAVNLLADGPSTTGRDRTILLTDGQYNESNTVLNKALTLQGESEAGVVIAPGAVDTGSGDFGGAYQYGLIVEASDILVTGLTIDGQANTGLGAGSNFRGGILTRNVAAPTYGNIDIVDNTILNTKHRGISLRTAGTGNLVQSNTLDNVNGYAILAIGASAEILDNVVTDSFAGVGANTLYTAGGPYRPDLKVQNNDIRRVAVGIYLAATASGTSASDNFIDTTGGATDDIGIIVSFSPGTVTVQGNTVTSSEGDAALWLFRNEAAPVEVVGNTFNSTGSTNAAPGEGTGIFLTDDNTLIGESQTGSGSANIQGNTIIGYAVGIDLHRAAGDAAPMGPKSLSATIGGTTPNTISGSGIGIRISNAATMTAATATATIDSNSITGNDLGILVTGAGASASIQGNGVVTPSGAVGISISGGAGATIGTNTIGGAGDTGVLVTGVGSSATLAQNIISDLATGIEVAAGASATLDTNDLADNTTGIVVDSATATLAGTNTIDGGTTGHLLTGASAALAGNSFGTTAFSGQSGDYITLASGAEDENVLDASGVSFDGLTPSGMSHAQRVATVNRITDALEDPGVGFVAILANTVLVNALDTYDTPKAATATVNDYTALANAVGVVSSGWKVLLTGTFDWTEANAAASWALGNDATASTDDDYSLLVPGGLNNLTFTANLLGDATIQGPGDLPTVNLEGVFYFPGGASTAADNQGLTISNLEILDFDLAIGMFNSGAGADAFSGATITGNRIRVPADLNATVAPADTNQNIGIHFSFGANQTISYNQIDIAGNGVSDTANGRLSTSVGMQSNTNGGAYNNLLITHNTLTVLDAQSADPAEIRGIWENGHAHLGNITVSNNTFTNADAGNDPLANRQRAFRVTSHSGASTSVVYSNNTVAGANIGFEWLAGSNFASYQPVVFSGNTLANVATGVLLQSNGKATITGSSFTNTGAMAGQGTAVSVAAGSSATVDGSTDENAITGFGSGILAAGTVSVSGNDASIHGNVVGIDVTGTATITGNHLYDNGTAIRFRDGGTGSLSGNNFDGPADDNDVDLLLAASAGTVTIGSNNAFAGDTSYIVNRTAQAFDLTANGTTYDGLSAAALDPTVPAERAQLFDIADRITDAVDVAAYGLVRVKSGHIFVTPASFDAPATTTPSIQRGVNIASPAETVWVEAGAYSENVTVNKALTLIGDGNTAGGTVLTAPGGVGINVTASGVTLKDLRVTGAARGIQVGGVANTTLDGIAAVGNVTGVEAAGTQANPTTNLVITGSELSDNSSVGFRMGTSAALNGLDLIGGTISGNSQGFVIFASTSAGYLTDVLIDGTTFSNNARKGAYIEKLSNATITNVTFTDNGTGAANNDNAGLDLNLKYGNYSNITLSNATFTGNGTGADAASDVGNSITIKARNDVAGSPRYDLNPATLTGLTLTNVSITAASGPGSVVLLTLGNDIDLDSVALSNVDLAGAGSTGLTVYGTDPGEALALADTSFDAGLAGYIVNSATGTTIDGTTATYGGVSGGNSLSDSNAFAISDKIVDSVDVSTLGKVILKNGFVYVTPNSFLVAGGTSAPSIQRGINVANVNDTVRVQSGTYAESPTINKSLSLIGDGSGSTTIDLLQPGTPGATYAGALTITGAGSNVLVQGFNLKGKNAIGGGLATTNVVLGLGLGTVTLDQNRFEVGAIGGGSNGDDGMGILTTYTTNPAQFAAALNVTGSQFAPVSAEGQRAFYINPGVTNFNFTGNTIAGKFAGTAITQADNGTVARNTITGNGAGSQGLGAWGYPTPSQFAEGTIFERNTISGVDNGISIFDSNGVVIRENFFSSVGNAVRFLDNGLASDPSTSQVVRNSFVGITGKAITNTDGGTLVAHQNWFGTTTEATVLGLVSGLANVDISPYLASGTDTDGATAGFQPGFGAVYVTASGAQSGGGPRIQEAIDLATGATPTVNVNTGTYVEAVAANKAGLTILGLGASPTIAPTGVANTIAVSANNVTLQNLAVNGIGLTPGGSGIVNTAAISGLTIQTVGVTNGTGAGITIDAQYGVVSGVTIASVNASSNSGGGVRLLGGATNSISGVAITGSTFSSNRLYGLQIQGNVASPTVSGSTFTWGSIISSPNTHGVVITGTNVAGANSPTGVNLSNNTFNSYNNVTPAYAITLTDPANSSKSVNNVTALNLTMDGFTYSPNPTYFNNRVFDKLDDPAMGLVTLSAVTSQIIDNGQPGFTTTGTWGGSNLGGVNGSSLFTATSPAATATWSFNVTPGNTYRVMATYPAHPNSSSNALYVVKDGGVERIGARLNQQVAPSSITAEGATWQYIGDLTPTSSNLAVVLSNVDANGNTRADAIRIVEIATPPPATIIDNQDPGFTTTGTWTSSALGGLNGSSLVSIVGNAPSTASWTFNVTPGKTYTVMFTYPAHPNSASNAPVSVLDGPSTVASLIVNQQLAPADITVSGATWKVLTTHTSSNSTLTVRIDHNANSNGNTRADAVRIVEVQPLQVEESATLPASLDVVSIDTAVLQFHAKAAINSWARAGLDRATLRLMRQVQFIVTDLPGRTLGVGAPGLVQIDPTAGGFGWSLLATPRLGSRLGLATTMAAPGIDLVSVIAHELGHTVGLVDLDPVADAGALMAATITPGARRLPTTADVVAIPIATQSPAPIAAADPVSQAVEGLYDNTIFGALARQLRVRERASAFGLALQAGAASSLPNSSIASGFFQKNRRFSR